MALEPSRVEVGTYFSQSKFLSKMVSLLSFDDMICIDDMYHIINCISSAELKY